jgi:hypothetical protein
MFVQSILINKHILDKRQAKRYIKRMGYTPKKKAHETKNYYRFRINNPNLFDYFVTKRINDIVTVVFGMLE